MSSPFVSICIPLYNMIETLNDSVFSVLRQSYANWELIIVDNSSTDGSGALAKELTREDPRVSVVNVPETVSMVENYNNCMSTINGDYVLFLSADDILHPDFLSECLNVFSINETLGYVSTSRNRIDENDVITDQPSFYNSSGIIPGHSETIVNLAGNHGVPSNILYNSVSLKAVGGFANKFPYCFDIYTKLRLNLSYDVGYVSKALCSYRVTSTRGPSLYRGEDFSPLFELYQIKMKVLGEMKTNRQEYDGLALRINKNLSRVSLSLSEFAWSVSNDVPVARAYLAFASGFSPMVVRTSRYSLLIAKLGAEVCGGGSIKTESEKPPYDLPIGSQKIYC